VSSRCMEYPEQAQQAQQPEQTKQPNNASCHPTHKQPRSSRQQVHKRTSCSTRCSSSRASCMRSRLSWLSTTKIKPCSAGTRSGCHTLARGGYPVQQGVVVQQQQQQQGLSLRATHEEESRDAARHALRCKPNAELPSDTIPANRTPHTCVLL